MMPSKKQCIFCGELFIPKRTNQLYCTPICSMDKKYLVKGFTPALVDTLYLLLEREDIGARINEYHQEKLLRWHWVIVEDDGYTRLNEWGVKTFTALEVNSTLRNCNGR